MITTTSRGCRVTTSSVNTGCNKGLLQSACTVWGRAGIWKTPETGENEQSRTKHSALKCVLELKMSIPPVPECTNKECFSKHYTTIIIWQHVAFTMHLSPFLEHECSHPSSLSLSLRKRERERGNRHTMSHLSGDTRRGDGSAGWKFPGKKSKIVGQKL